MDSLSGKNDTKITYSQNERHGLFIMLLWKEANFMAKYVEFFSRKLVK